MKSKRITLTEAELYAIVLALNRSKNTAFNHTAVHIGNDAIDRLVKRLDPTNTEEKK